MSNFVLFRIIAYVMLIAIGETTAWLVTRNSVTIDEPSHIDGVKEAEMDMKNSAVELEREKIIRLLLHRVAECCKSTGDEACESCKRTPELIRLIRERKDTDQ